MLYKFSISISGENFFAEEAASTIQTHFFCNDHFNPDTPKFFVDPTENFEFGGVSYIHPMKFVNCDYLHICEDDIIQFMLSNYNTWCEYGATDFKIYMEVVTNGDRIDLEVFTNSKLKKLAPMNVSINISIHTIKPTELILWEREVNRKWKNKYPV